MKIFVTSDTHLFHSNIIEYEGRPDNYNELIIENWNRHVTDDDLVIHLGDFALTDSITMKKTIMSLPGRKVIVRGNHDKSIPWFMSNGFAFACNSFSWRYSNHHILFTHMPKEHMSGDYSLNVHGHLHSKSEEVLPLRYCVSIERLNYRLIELDDLLGRYQKGIRKWTT